jgi:hypothetical protein
LHEYREGWARMDDQIQAGVQTVTAGEWGTDPFGRHEYRYWDGREWTDHVSDGGRTSLDPASLAPAKPLR